MDEAYLHFHEAMDTQTAFPFVKQGKNVIVARTFSKIYGMAGMRIGFAVARPDIISKMEPFRNAVIGMVHRLGLSGRAKSPSSAAPLHLPSIRLPVRTSSGRVSSRNMRIPCDESGDPGGR